MRKNTLSLTMLTVVCGCAFNSVAQYDSSRLDAGYLSFRKEFTQTIIVKGADLEKMPFANLSDALSAWLFGAFVPAAVLGLLASMRLARGTKGVARV